MRRVLPLALILLATTAAAQVDFPIATQRIGPAPGGRANVQAATSREAALIVWDEGRGMLSEGRLWGARVSKNGVLLDPTGIVLGEPAPLLLGIGLDVASDGEGFLAIYRRNGQIRLTHVDAAGKAVDGATIATDTRFAKLVLLGGEYALFYTDGTEPRSPRVQMAILDREGRVLISPREVLRSTHGVLNVTAALGNGGSDVLLVWTDGNDSKLHALRLPVADLRRGVTQPILEAEQAPGTTQAPHEVVVASDGSGYLIVWKASNEVRARRVSAAGTPAGEAILLDANSNRQSSVAWNGTHYLVATGDGGATRAEVNLHRITPAGAATGPQMFIVGDARTMELASWSSGDVLAAWHFSDYQGVTQIRFDIVSPAGTSQFGIVSGGKSISDGFPDRRLSNAVWRGDHYLAAWTESFGSGQWVVYGRFTATGTLLDGAGRVASRPAVSEPSLASDGRGALLAWREGEGNVIAFIDEAGNVTEAYRVPGTYVFTPLVHWNGSQYLAMWGELGKTMGMRFDARGNRIDAAPVVMLPQELGPTAIGWTGSEYVVFRRVIEFCFPICYAPVHLDAISFSRDLMPIGGIVRLAATSVTTEGPAVGESAAGLLVVFGWRTSPTATTQLRGIRIAPNGTTLDIRDGFAIGEGSVASVYATAGGWNVVSGPKQWHVSASGRVTGPELAYPFVAAGQRSLVVLGGPGPLVVYQRPPVGSHQSADIVARLLLTNRRRATR